MGKVCASFKLIKFWLVASALTGKRAPKITSNIPYGIKSGEMMYGAGFFLVLLADGS
jgi:hypothetical protein